MSRLLWSVVVLLIVSGVQAQSTSRWSEAKANDWYQHQPWLIGSNFLPANAINELEMWQADTFDPQEIDKELGWAQGLGMDTMRVFLHDLLWHQDSAGFKKRIDTFLTIAAKHHIRPLFVLFVEDPAQEPKLRAYVQGVVGAFATDSRILGWDVWNEPSNTNGGAYGRVELKDKQDRVRNLLPKVFEWARSVNPSQPLTSGLWEGDWSSPEKLDPIARIQFEQSDVISFHNYSWPEDFEQHVRWLEKYHRPILCSEFMARPMGSTFETILPIAKQHHVAAINWGFVAGKSQTYLPWDSWEKPYVLQPPPVWFHEVLHPDGTPYREREAQIIRQLSGVEHQN